LRVQEVERSAHDTRIRLEDQQVGPRISKRPEGHSGTVEWSRVSSPGGIHAPCLTRLTICPAESPTLHLATGDTIRYTWSKKLASPSLGGAKS
jgi:hypothetical protein